MITQFKRGHQLQVIETGETVYFYIQKEGGKCLVCTDKSFGLGSEYLEKELSDLRALNKVKSSISSKPKPITDKAKSDKQILDEFFVKISLTMPFLCTECNTPLRAFNKFAKRCVSAHILAKAQFPSIATNPDNIVFLGVDLTGGCSCHTKYDGLGAEYRSKMKIYPLLLERFEKLKPFLTDKEIIKAETYLHIKHE